MNFVFISPNFPRTSSFFCQRLHENGVNVLGIGEAPYELLEDWLRASMTEYYYVSSLKDYDQVYRAVAFFTFKYGRVDWLESMNEYWLELDAQLRTDFNIAVGTRSDSIAPLKEKSLMKQVYLAAGIPTARQHVVSTRQAGRAFAKEVGYPVIVKPDVGVGANDTWKLSNETELEAFYNRLPNVPYVMEEFIEGDICSYDAIIDSRGLPLFESMSVYAPVMDCVLEDLDIFYYTAPEPAPKLRALGRKTVRAFGVDRRFVHLEFFRLAKARKGLGEAGDYVALEVNMRPAGGRDPDMMNYAHSVDVYKIYADMVTTDRRFFPEAPEQFYCAYAARKDGHRYTHIHDEVMAVYGDSICRLEEMPPIDWPQMGRYLYMARFRTLEEVEDFLRFVVG